MLRVQAGKDLLLSYDFGTSSVKAALFDAEGKVLGSARHRYPLLLPRPGWAEQRPQDWWQAMGAVTRAVLAAAQVPPARIAAINVAAQMCGTLPVDRAGEPLGNCLIWLDTRSEAIARRITSGLVRVGGYGVRSLARWMRRTNGAPNLSGNDPTSKILWIREQAPEIWNRTYKILDVKDYLLFRCCGNLVTTPDCAHLTWLMDARAGRRRWSPELLADLGLEETLLPEIREATEVVGQLGAGAAGDLGLESGTPVVAGAGDVTACALGAGSIAAGETHLHIGTSAWLGAHLPRPRVDVFTAIGTICSAHPGSYLLVAAQQSAGVCVEWTARALGRFDGAAVAAGSPGSGADDVPPPDFAAFDRAAESAPPGARSLMFLPWMYGERVPVCDAYLRGGFINLSLEHGSPELARSVLEGVALNARWAMRGVDRLTGNGGSPLRFLGGGANSGVWCQILADILQRPIMQMALPDLGAARGMAMSAAVAIGWFTSLEQAMSMARVAGSFEPRADVAAIHENRFALFVDHYKRNRRWYRRMNSAPDGLH